jgi:hypothetical protein
MLGGDEDAVKASQLFLLLFLIFKGDIEFGVVSLSVLIHVLRVVGEQPTLPSQLKAVTLGCKRYRTGAN